MVRSARRGPDSTSFQKCLETGETTKVFEYGNTETEKSVLKQEKQQHPLDTFCIQRILLFFLFPDTFRIQGILPILLFLETFRIRGPQMTSDGPLKRQRVSLNKESVWKQQNPLLEQKCHQRGAPNPLLDV